MLREANLHWRYEDTESGLILPWYTLPCLQWLKSQDTKGWVVFEYGCGYSTIWWRLNCIHVISIESNPEWAKAMHANLKEEMEGYVKSIEFYTTPSGRLVNPELIIEGWPENFPDCIVVDGLWRLECVDFSRDHLRDGGYLIFDNYNQEGFEDKDAIDKLLEGWEKQVFKQPNHTDWSTAVFKKPNTWGDQPDHKESSQINIICSAETMSNFEKAIASAIE